MHLPLAAPEPASGSRRAMPGPYPERPPFQPPPPPSAGGPPLPERWEGTGFRPDVQGMRAIAVMLVLLSHAGFGFASGGYVGVDVFFVISGFLITSLLIKEVFDTGTISLVGFFSRRARRILPAATVVTIATVIGAWLWFPITRFEEVMRDAFTVIVYAVNYRFVVENTEYLNADAMPTPFQQYWSLAVEEQFYLVWPLLLLGVLLLAKRIPRQALNLAIGVIAVVFVLSLITSVLVTESSQPTAYYATHTRVWELAGGALIALTLPVWRTVHQALALILGLAGLAAVIGAALLYDESTSFPGYAALLPVLGTMMLIVAGTGRGANAVSTLLATGSFQFVGKISYSLYLWHWPILILAPLGLGVESSNLLNVILLACTFAIAQLSYEYIETPIRNAGLLRTHHFYGIATGVLCSILSIAMVLTLTLGFSRASDDGIDTDLATIEETESSEELERSLSEGLEIDKAPHDLTPSLTNVGDDKPLIYDSDCHLEFEEIAPPDQCVFGDAESDTTVVLFGDSHAAQWFPALDSLAAEHDWRLVPRTKSACTPVDVAVENSQLQREYTECEEWRHRVYDELDKVRPTLVVVSASDGAPTLDSSNRNWENGWTTTLQRLTSAAEHVTTLTDTPRTTGMAAPECISLHLESPSQCIETDPYSIKDLERREIGIEIQESHGATVIDVVDWFCLDSRCPLIADNLLIYRDTHHISTPYSKSLATLLHQRLPEL
ncbi:acyltransferase family protein [Glycomyces xiaoerkulensis]|uniref:acyltransferase family protein n=1 Tax=Glycomyces xiaoerkulensis TaxID=2038139 RepID=UPI0012FFF43B|nr:acyltransferase family protein [Glycomyces xiaoerkulensis]